MSIAQQISELLSLKRDGLISADDVAFAIRELKAGASAAPHEEKKVAPPKPDVRANLKRARKAEKAIIAAVHKTPAKKARAVDEFEDLVEELEHSVRHHNSTEGKEIRLEDYHPEPDEDVPEAKRSGHDVTDLKYDGDTFYYVAFRVQIIDEDQEVGKQNASDHLIRTYTRGKNSPRAMFFRLKSYFKKDTTFWLDEQNDDIFKTFGWVEWARNRYSKGGAITIEQFRPCPAHEVGAWDIENRTLFSRGVIQPTIGTYGGRFVKGGEAIARPEFYRADSCMTSLFLEWAAAPMQLKKGPPLTQVERIQAQRQAAALSRTASTTWRPV